MADFELAFGYMIQNEDYATTDPRYGKVNTDNDGGMVRFGVNSNSLGKDLLNTSFYTTMDVPTAYKVASNLYNNTVWHSMHGDDITSQRVASKILDMAVNEGIVQASKLAQRAAGVNVDGVIGSITVGAINLMNEDDMLKGLVQWNLWLIQEIIKNKPQDIAYETNWKARAEKLPPAA